MAHEIQDYRDIVLEGQRTSEKQRMSYGHEDTLRETWPLS